MLLEVNGSGCAATVSSTLVPTSWQVEGAPVRQFPSAPMRQYVASRLGGRGVTALS
jgi:hypothetical protein